MLLHSEYDLVNMIYTDSRPWEVDKVYDLLEKRLEVKNRSMTILDHIILACMKFVQE
jgi:hypothetical protein